MPYLSRAVCLTAVFALTPLSSALSFAATDPAGASAATAGYTNQLSQTELQSLLDAASRSDDALRERAAQLMARDQATARSVYRETRGLITAQQSSMLESMLQQQLATGGVGASAGVSTTTSGAGATGAGLNLAWIAGGGVVAGVAVAAGGGGGGGSSSRGGDTGAPTPPPDPTPEPEDPNLSLPTAPPPPSNPIFVPGPDQPASAPSPGPAPGPENPALRTAPPLGGEHDWSNGFNLTYGHIAHDRGFTGANSLIAVIDSGMRSTHRELDGQIAGHYNLITGGTTAADAADTGGHGTHVAGTIAARRGNGGSVGYAYGARLLNIRFTNDNDEVTATDRQLANGFAWGRQRGATWFNNSWGIDATAAEYGRGNVAGAFPALLAEWRLGATDNRVYVWSTGNEGGAEPLVFAAMPQLFPELQNNWIAVASVDSDTGLISPFSNRCGAAAAWCMVAPGSDIVSSYEGADNAYAIASGTSMATPAVTGALAVVSQAFPTLAPEQVVQRLFYTATKDGVYANQSIYGQGLLDLERATRPVGTLNLVTTSGQVLPVDEAGLVLGAPFGYSNPFAGVSVMAADQLEAGFVVDIGQQVSLRRYRYDTSLAFDRLARNWQTETDGQRTLTWTGHGDPADGSFVMTFDQGAGHSLSIGQVDDMDLLESTRSWAGMSQLDASLSSPFWTQQAGEQTLGMRQRMPVGNASLELTSAANALRQGVALGLRLPVGERYSSTFEVGYVSGRDGLFESRGRGMFDLGRASNTYYTGIRGQMHQGRFALDHAAYLGQSEGDSRGLLRDMGSVITSSWVVAGRYQVDDSIFGMVMQQPLRVESARSDVTLATGYAGNLFDMQTVSLDLAPDGRQINLEAFWQKPVNRSSDLKLSWLGIRQPGHQASADAMQVFMAQWQQRF